MPYSLKIPRQPVMLFSGGYDMWIVYRGNEDVAQFETRKEAEDHARSLNLAYETNIYRVEHEKDY